MTSPAIVSSSVTTAAMWAGLRLVAIDFETTEEPDDPATERAVSVAVVECRDGRIASRWQTMLNPEVPIDRRPRPAP